MRTCPDISSLHQSAAKLAADICKFEALTLSLAKSTIKMASYLDETSASQVERVVFDSLFNTSGSHAGFAAFLNRKRRKPLRPKM